jgi:hypothetical protein
MTMTDEDAIHYVNSMASALSLPLAPDRALRVAAHLARNAQIAQVLDRIPLDAYDELAAIYCPAPFPSAKPNGGEHA